MNSQHMCVVGAGAWGTALAQCWASALNRGFETVTLVARTEEHASAISSTRANERYLPGQTLSSKLQISADGDVLNAASHIAFVTPAQGFAQLSKDIAPHINTKTAVILCSKGIDAESGRSMSTIAKDAFADNPVSVL